MADYKDPDEWISTSPQVKQFRDALVQAVHDDLVGVLRSGEFSLSAAKIVDQVWGRGQQSAVNGQTYPVGALVGWTDMHTANVEGAVRGIVEHLGGTIVPSDREGNFTVSFDKAS